MNQDHLDMALVNHWKANLHSLEGGTNVMQIGELDGEEGDGSLGNFYLELHIVEMQGDWENPLEGSRLEGSQPR